MQLWQRKSGELTFTHEGLVAPDTWSWQEVCATSAMASFPTTATLSAAPELEAGAIEVAPGALRDIEAAEDAKATTQGGIDVPADTDPAAEESDISDMGESTVTSPSASDVSAEGQDLVGVIPPEGTIDHVKWFLQGTKIHVLRSDDLQGRRLPWCRETAFHQDPQQIGEGITTMDISKMCQRCLSRMPRVLYAALSEHCGWLH